MILGCLRIGKTRTPVIGYLEALCTLVGLINYGFSIGRCDWTYSFEFFLLGGVRFSRDESSKLLTGVAFWEVAKERISESKYFLYKF